MKREESLIRRMAILLVSHAAKVLPPKREEWARAMVNEIDFLTEDRIALKWAIGCVYTSYWERVADMSVGTLRVSRAVLTVEMLMCFGIPCMVFFGMLFHIGNFIPFNRDLFSVFLFTASLIGPVGLNFAFRFIALKRNVLGKSVVAVLCVLATWTLMVHGIAIWIAAELPNTSTEWSAVFLLAVLPALGVAHLIYNSNPEERTELSA